jgi:hypothetical protein
VFVALVGSALAARAAEAPPVHEDAAEALGATLDTVRAILLDDGAAARSAMDRVQRQCRRLNAEEESVFGVDMVNNSRSFHVALNRAREYAAAGDLAQALDNFVWVQRSCRLCHALGRERGLLTRGAAAAEKAAQPVPDPAGDRP